MIRGLSIICIIALLVLQVNGMARADVDEQSRHGVPVRSEGAPQPLLERIQDFLQAERIALRQRRELQAEMEQQQQQLQLGSAQASISGRHLLLSLS